jgi:hypothetical protein
VEDIAMISNLIRSRKQSRPERPSFRPVLESLERREVPSSATVSAAFHALPGDVANVNASMVAHDTNGINSNLAVVIKDVFILRTGAPGFVTPDRLQIDNALFINGIRLVFDGFNNLNVSQNENVVANVIGVGIRTVEAGLIDFAITGFFPNSSGSAVLT